MVGEVLVPVNNTEFSAYIQRVKDAKPDAVFVFVGAGIPSVAFFKAFHQAGLDKLGIRILASGDTLEEDALPQMGDEPDGVISSLNYSEVHDSKAQPRVREGVPRRRFDARRSSRISSPSPPTIA